MYDFALHEMLGRKTTHAAQRVVEFLYKMLPCKVVLDVGCGDGRWLAAFAERGAMVHGVDGAWTDATKLCIPPDCFEIRDLTQPFTLDRRFDIALSLEVAEHLPETAAASFVNTLTRHADVVLFSAAIPHQGGFRHVNEQWQSYWVRRFAQYGYQMFDPFRPVLWSDDAVDDWYKQNLLLYVDSLNHPAREAVERFMADNRIAPMPADIVNPECYRRVAEYDLIEFKPLLQKLPKKSFLKTLDFASRVMR
jgi:SAM-dependent methyltransferase